MNPLLQLIVDIAHLSHPGVAELLAEGIYLALETTVAGLIIAIPCVLMAAFFNGRTEKYMRELAELMMDTLPCFDRMEKV